MVLHLLVSVLHVVFGRFYRLIEHPLGNGRICAEIDYTKESSGGDREEEIIAFVSLQNENSPLLTEDRISSLPDDILTSILSSLTLKVAVKTSVLSRRWRYLSASRSDLNLDFSTLFGIRGQCWLGRREHLCLKYTHRFVEGVNQILKVHVGTKISSFRAAFCFEPAFASDIDSWICLAIRKGVEKLDLSFVCSCYSFLSGSDQKYDGIEFYLFSCQLLCEAPNLKHLRLYSCILKTDLSCQIVGLTTLDLHYVDLAHDELHSVLSSCLNLECLRLRGCRLPDKLSVFGPARLTFFMVENCEGVKEMELSAVSLTTFEIMGEVLIRLSFRLHKLEKLFVRIYSLGSQMPYNLCDLAEDLPQLKILQITVYYPVNFLSSSLKPFSNVTQLEFFIMCGDGTDHSKIITPILRAFPLLQKLYIALPTPANNEIAYNVRRRMVEPTQFLHSHLREIEIGGYNPTWDNIEVAIALLENAIALERMIINLEFKFYLGGKRWKCGQCTFGWSEDISKWTYNKLFAKRSSKNTKVIIQSSTSQKSRSLIVDAAAI